MDFLGCGPRQVQNLRVHESVGESVFAWLYMADLCAVTAKNRKEIKEEVMYTACIDLASTAFH